MPNEVCKHISLVPFTNSNVSIILIEDKVNKKFCSTGKFLN